jgi:hypothetical protein
LSVDAKLLLRRRARIDRDDDAKALERASRNVVNILINITLSRALRDVDLTRSAQSIRSRQSIYNSTNEIFENFHEIRESIELTSNDEEISLLVRTLALSLLHQFSKRQHLAHSRSATSVALNKDDNDRSLFKNLSRSDIERRVNLQ